MIKRVIFSQVVVMPGMRAAICSTIHSALSKGLEVFGIYDGHLGLHENRMIQLDRCNVSDNINREETFLGSAYFPEFLHSVNSGDLCLWKKSNTDTFFIFSLRFTPSCKCLVRIEKNPARSGSSNHIPVLQKSLEK